MNSFRVILATSIVSVCASLALASSSIAQQSAAEPSSEVVLRSEIKFQPLNPARGDASPRAGRLWGDIRKDSASGAIIEFVDGFSSPPHIHNITYRAVVISGAVHNDDPDAEMMWMGPGSFWTQPAGEPHITVAKPGSNATIFLEIQTGPYLVLPTDKAFEDRERPINVDASNIVWLDASDLTWVDQSAAMDADSPAMAFLWGDPQDDAQPAGTLVKLPGGFAGELRSNGSALRAVVIQGQLTHQLPEQSKVNSMEPGSYFGSQGESVHQVSCKTEQACVVYVRVEEGKFDIVAS